MPRGKLGEDGAEQQVGEVLGDPLFVELAFIKRTLMERPMIGTRYECLAAEDEGKHFEPVTLFVRGKLEQPLVVAGDPENGGKIDLEELFRNGSGTGVIKPPAATVGQNAPA